MYLEILNRKWNVHSSKVKANGLQLSLKMCDVSTHILLYATKVFLVSTVLQNYVLQERELQRIMAYDHYKSRINYSTTPRDVMKKFC